MFGQIARFELRYQLRNPVFWTVAILFFLLTFGSMTIDQIKIGSGANIHKNAPVAVAQVHQIMSIFFMFVTTAFVANVIVRDDESGFGPMVRSTRVGKFDYLMARFLGAFAAAALAFAAIPLAIWLGSLMPWVDHETLGPNRLHDFAYAYFFLALPNVFLTSAIFFAVATMTRSMMYSYLGVVVFLMLYLAMTSILRAKPEWQLTGSYFELFGISAFIGTTRYWTASEANAGMPAFTGVLMWNRVITIGVGLMAMAVAYARFSFTERGVSKRRLRKQQRATTKLAATAPLIVESLPAARSNEANWTRMIARCRFEMALVFRSPAFVVLLLIGLFNTLGGMLFANEMFGAPIRQLTFAVIATLEGTFSIIPLIIAIYYSGELVWRDRERGMHEIVDATSLPNWAYLVPKVLAITGVLFATAVMAALTACVVQLARGQTDLALGHYLAWWVLPMTVDAAILAILAVFVQALSPNKIHRLGDHGRLSRRHDHVDQHGLRTPVVSIWQHRDGPAVGHERRAGRRPPRMVAEVVLGLGRACIVRLRAPALAARYGDAAEGPSRAGSPPVARGAWRRAGQCVDRDGGKRCVSVSRHERHQPLSHHAGRRGAAGCV
ncbi:ABC transporter permease [Sphingomonas faeni]|uniref:ABC transporter permease n=1 Tax=Sphingomonas faeni TaxID=185950 RepID=UPI0027832F4D|nr:hypothetical protein [Sphingomonas faeni]MDQ0837161.1 ABC-type transport system involved in multi-copper enzyme maturation permease subunit [Sphingomonas faeni]